MATQTSLFQNDRSIRGDPNFFRVGTAGDDFQGPRRTSEFQRQTSGLLADQAGKSQASKNQSVIDEGIAAFANVGANIINTKAVQSSLGSSIDQLQENITRRNKQKNRIRVASDRIRTSMGETADQVVGANIVSAYASGITNTGSAALANERVISQLGFNRFIVFSDAEIQAAELDRQNALAQEQIRKLKAAQSKAGLIGAIKTGISVAGIFFGPKVAEVANIGVDIGASLSD